MIAALRIVLAVLAVCIASPRPANAQFAAQQTWCVGSCVGGSANAVTLAIPNIVTASDLKGVPVRFVPTVSNTAGVVLTVGSTPGLPVVKPGVSGPTPLSGGEFAPNSPIIVISDGTEYNYYAGGFLNGAPALNAPISYYVSNSGLDSNNCLTPAAACLTIQHALVLVNRLNLNGYSVTINLADGVYAPITLPLLNGSGSVIINGDAANPANTIIFNSTQGSAIVAGATIGYVVQNVLLETTAPSAGDPAVGVWGSGANMSLTNVYFGSCNGGYVVADAGRIALFGNIVISGGIVGNSLSIGAAFRADLGGVILVGPNLITLSITAPVTMPYFIYAIENGSIVIVYSAITGKSNVTGTRYQAALNGIINSNGGGAAYYPGNVGGSTSSGGQYN